MNTVRISVKKAGQYWKGAMRNEAGELVWECLHYHHNRDQSTKSSGTSARDCARNAEVQAILVNRSKV